MTTDKQSGGDEERTQESPRDRARRRSLEINAPILTPLETDDAIAEGEPYRRASLFKRLYNTVLEKWLEWRDEGQDAPDSIVLDGAYRQSLARELTECQRLLADAERRGAQHKQIAMLIYYVAILKALTQGQKIAFYEALKSELHNRYQELFDEDVYEYCFAQVNIWNKNGVILK